MECDARRETPLPRLPAAEWRALLAGLISAGLAAGGLWLVPQAELAIFARGAAGLAALLTGSSVEPVEAGWLLAGTGQPVVVSAVCSATGFFTMVATLLGWRLAQSRVRVRSAVLLALAAALPVTLLVNALRVVVLMHAHHRVIPRFPDAYGPFLHLLAGVAIFLPALIGLNLLFEYHGNRHRRAC